MPRIWKPRPSAGARARILDAIRDLIAAQNADAAGWTAGYAVTLTQIRARLTGSLSYCTLRLYLTHMVRAGDLERVGRANYVLGRGAYTTFSHPIHARCIGGSASSPEAR